MCGKPEVGTTNQRLLLRSAAVVVVPGPSGAAKSSAPGRDAPRTVAARCGRRGSATQRRCSGSARTPPTAWACYGPSRCVATSLPASCGARRQDSTQGCGPGLAPPSDALPVQGLRTRIRKLGALGELGLPLL